MDKIKAVDENFLDEYMLSVLVKFVLAYRYVLEKYN